MNDFWLGTRPGAGSGVGFMGASEGEQPLPGGFPIP
jgi:hypothetical protein